MVLLLLYTFPRVEALEVSQQTETGEDTVTIAQEETATPALPVTEPAEAPATSSPENPETDPSENRTSPDPSLP